MKSGDFPGRALAIVLTLGMSGGWGWAQTQSRPSARPGAASRSDQRAVHSVDDPGIPSPDEFSPSTDSRLFAESFFKALSEGSLEAVYQDYFQDSFKSKVPPEVFNEKISRMRQALGPLRKLRLVRLKQINKAFGGRDGGFVAFVLVYDHDPRVKGRVDFRRDDHGMWRIANYGLISTQMERQQRAREAARKAQPPPHR
ncbi:MAG: DUF4019 domain-containing protein [Acidobacteriota bacterium]